MKTDKKIEVSRIGEIIEAIKDYFVGCGVKQKEDGRIVTYFTPYSATEFTEKLAEHIDENYTPNTEVQKAREEAVRGFVEHLKPKGYMGSGDEHWSYVQGLIETKAEIYLQSLDKGDTDRG